MPPIIDLLSKVVEQGTEEKVFKTDHHKETAIAILGISQQFGEGKHDHALRRKIDMDELVKVLEIIERVLGARKGLFIEYYKEL